MGDYSSHSHPKRVWLFQKPKKQAQAQNRKRFRAELCRLSFWTRPGFNSLWPEPEPPLSFQVIQSIKTAEVGFLTFMSLGNGLISWHSKNSWAQIFRAWWQYYKNILILKSVLHNHGLFKAWYALDRGAVALSVELTSKVLRRSVLLCWLMRVLTPVTALGGRRKL